VSRFRDIGPIPEPVIWNGATVLARDAQGRVLMQLRDDIGGIAAPGQWSLFGGGAEPGEDLETAARREFHEETGIDIDGETLEPVARFASQALRGGVVHVFALARPIAPGEVRLGEGAGFAMLTRGQAETFDLIENFRKVVLRLADF
jgi:8-oxo-dGTP diphosphatase